MVRGKNKTRKAYIVSAEKAIDQPGGETERMAHCLALEGRIAQLGHKIHHLYIDPLSVDWHSPVAEDHFRSGCGPVEALARAKELVTSGTPAVLISGEDHLKSGYARDERLQYMAIYGEDYPLTEAYTDLAHAFIRLHHSSAADFRHLAYQLFENYQLSYRHALGDKLGAEQLPAERWYQPVTELFRGVDCANPVVDFSGRLLVCSLSVVQELGLEARELIEVRAVGLGESRGDGRAHVEQIASYEHLKQAYENCCRAGAVDFAHLFRRGLALLETYTCYPVVPMAFLLASGLVDVLEDIPEFLEQHRITLTGGMNLARAPWNNPALNALIDMHHALLKAADEQVAMVHGNGGLGYRQGVALLRKVYELPA